MEKKARIKEIQKNIVKQGESEKNIDKTRGNRGKRRKRSENRENQRKT